MAPYTPMHIFDIILIIHGCRGVGVWSWVMCVGLGVWQLSGLE